jgi:TRAP-type C4-dicarboxylate transport system substrate-binding protein
MKIRTFASPLQMEPMKSVGAIPVPLALTEVIPQLQSAASTACSPACRSSPRSSITTSPKYVTDLNFAQIISINVVNENWFKAQPKDVQDAIRDAGARPRNRCSPGASRT